MGLFRLAPLIAFVCVLSGCPAMPPVVPIVDALYEAATQDITEAQESEADVQIVAPIQATEFGPCESALDCLTYPNSASVCEFQTCALQCVPGFANCDRETENGCEQSLSTPANCGGCDLVCAPPKAFGSCATGTCLVAACNLGFGDCDNLADNGCETMLVTVSDCAECGRPCVLDNAQTTCDAGICAIAECLPGYGDCDEASDNGCETEIDTRLRCGACDSACAPGQGCAFDHCAPSFSPPLDQGLKPQALGVGEAHSIYVLSTLSEALAWPSSEEVLSPQGAADVVLQKQGPEGELLWHRVFGGLNRDSASDLIVDSQERIVFSGSFQSGFKFKGALLPHTGGQDVFILSLDPSGEPLWGLGLGGFGDDSASALALGPNDEVAFMGSAHSPASFGAEVLTHDDEGPFGVVALYSAQGVALWTSKLSATTPLQLIDLQVGPNGRVQALVDAPGAPLFVDDEEVGDPPALLTWTADGEFVDSRSIEVAQAKAFAIDSDGKRWVAGLDSEGSAYVFELDTELSQHIALPSIDAFTLGPEGAIYTSGQASGAFDVGLGPVVVSAHYAARYSAASGEAEWFVALEGLGADPRMIKTPSGIALAGDVLIHLDD